MRRVPETNASFRRTDFEGNWLKVEDAIRRSHVKVYGLETSTLIPIEIGTVTFKGSISSDTLVAIEIHYGDFNDSRSPHASVTTFWSQDLRTIANAERVNPDPDYVGVGVDYGEVNWTAEGKGDRDDWSGSIEIDDIGAGIRISVEASHWTEGRVRLTLVKDIEQLLQQRRELIRKR